MNAQPAPTVADPLESYETELALYKLHSVLFALNAGIKPTIADALPTLKQLHARDPDRARRVLECLKLAASLTREAVTTLGDGIDWPTIDELYFPAEDGFTDTPGQWNVLGQIAAQNAANGNGCAPIPRRAAVSIESPAEEAAPAAPAAPDATKATRKAPSRAALASLGRSLKRDTESEKRRFYAIAKKQGMPTGQNAKSAMFVALSELFDEEITSHSQLNASRWGRAASAVEMHELSWTTGSMAPLPR